MSKVNNNIIIYQTKEGSLELKTDFKSETVWASQKQIARIFGVTSQNITMHINNIFEDGELEMKATCKESLQVQTEGHRTVKRKVQEYNLDVIISVGYRVNSVLATKFRKWATQTLKQHITQGYSINQDRIENDHSFLVNVIAQLKNLAHKKIDNDDVLELIKTFSYTWFSLQSYDEQKFPNTDTSTDIEISSEEICQDIEKLRLTLLNKGEATELFAQEKTKGSLDSILKNVFQNVFGQELYPSVEEKAAHLLYFVVKNHPFNDGNKRTGAFAFVWLLKKLRYVHKITPEALSTLTILVAESAPTDKDKMVGMILILLAGHSYE